MSNMYRVPEELNVGRSDPVYMAHSYLTKVPVTAILPFLKAYSVPGDVILDPFAGSGMTGVAAAMTGRSAHLFDVSVLGQHVGNGYTTHVDPERLQTAALEVINKVRARVGDIYGVKIADGSATGQLAKTVWSMLFACSSCLLPVNYYRALEAADWSKPEMRCPNCTTPISSKNTRVGEEPVVDFVTFAHLKTQVEQPHQNPVQSTPDLETVAYPHVQIPEDREMFQASALAKNGMTTIGAFYSPRNLYVLTSLWEEIRALNDPALTAKLLFAFTACLARASKRYQWSRARPLNAANANYYVAPVFYEWNVFELFERKVNAATRSDAYIQEERRRHVSIHGSDTTRVSYEVGSADDIRLPDGSVDYIFTDPPFGSNLFYADMAIFQEAWLPSFTDVTKEAVIDRSRRGTRTATRYEHLLTRSFQECRRVLKPEGRISVVFGNSSGKIWAMVQRAIADANLQVIPEDLVVLNKGQRSVKGLASGFEHVATLDLIITMTPQLDGANSLPPTPPDEAYLEQLVTKLISDSVGRTPSHLYLELLRACFKNNWSVERLDLKIVVQRLLDGGYELDSKSGVITEPASESAA